MSSEVDPPANTESPTSPPVPAAPATKTPTKILEAMLNPAVLVALFGSFGVAMGTALVSKILDDRKLQLSVVETLMEHTREMKLEARDIAKLTAYTRLIKENPQFQIDTDGFGAIINTFNEEQEEQAEREVERLRAELESEEQDDSETTELLRQAQAELDERKLKTAAFEQSVSSSSAQLAERLQRAEEDMRRAQDQARRADEMAVQQRARADEVAREVERATQRANDVKRLHRIRFEIATDDPGDGMMTLQFASLEPSSQGGVAWEFGIPNYDKGRRVIERQVMGLEFLNSPFVQLTNESCQEWWGTIVVLIDDARSFAVRVTDEADLQGVSARASLRELVGTNAVGNLVVTDRGPRC